MTDSVPPGWYPDPEMAGTQRYWDGARWSDHVAPDSAGQHRPGASRADSNLETWGWLGAIFLTPVGFIIAIVMMSKGQAVGHQPVRPRSRGERAEQRRAGA